MEKSLFSRNYEVLVAALREAREKAKLSQVMLAKKLGETQSFVSKCERGERRLDVVELRFWCQAIGTPFLEFVKHLDRRLTD